MYCSLYASSDYLILVGEMLKAVKAQMFSQPAASLVVKVCGDRRCRLNCSIASEMDDNTV